MGGFEHSTRIQRLLDRLHAGDPSARAELVSHAESRLRTLTRRMFHLRPELCVLDETDDVFQKSVLRLHQSLAKVHPRSGLGGVGSRPTALTAFKVAHAMPPPPPPLAGGGGGGGGGRDHASVVQGGK